MADLDRLIADAGLERFRAYATLELALVPDPDGTAFLGGTFAGERPVHRWPLAEVAAWPAYARGEVEAARAAGEVDNDGEHLVLPLPLLLQLDLDGRDPRLPASGTLAFFAHVTTDLPDPLFAKRVAAAVVYQPARRPAPEGSTALRLEPAIHWDIPFELLDGLVLPAPSHALFPAPAEELAGPMPPPGELALVRIHGDDIGDAAWITFSIPEAALRERRFEAARASVFIG